jgi:hypothetical protein
LGLTLLLNVPNHALEDFGRLDVGRRIDRADNRRGFVLALLVRDLADELGKPVDGEAGTSVKFALTSNLSRPLVRGSELEVVQHLGAHRRFGIRDRLESLVCEAEEGLNGDRLARGAVVGRGRVLTHQWH